MRGDVHLPGYRKRVHCLSPIVNQKCQGDHGRSRANYRCCLPALAGFVSPQSMGPGSGNLPQRRCGFKGKKLTERGLNVSQAGQFGQISRALAIPSNPRTASQMSLRTILSRVAAHWRVLEEAQRAAWMAAAKEAKSNTRLGHRPG